MKGIDLSQWNIVKDYEAIKTAGYDFAINALELLTSYERTMVKLMKIIKENEGKI